MDLPAFEWPKAPFPKLQYPLHKYESQNRAEEDRCLEAVCTSFSIDMFPCVNDALPFPQVEKIISTFHNPVAALVVEPIQAEGGDNWASPNFFQGLREITKRKGVAFIVDEVRPLKGPLHA